MVRFDQSSGYLIRGVTSLEGRTDDGGVIHPKIMLQLRRAALLVAGFLAHLPDSPKKGFTATLPACLKIPFVPTCERG